MLRLVHSDVYGSKKLVYLSGNRYFVTVIDVASKEGKIIPCLGGGFPQHDGVAEMMILFLEHCGNVSIIDVASKEGRIISCLG